MPDNTTGQHIEKTNHQMTPRPVRKKNLRSNLKYTHDLVLAHPKKQENQNIERFIHLILRSPDHIICKAVEIRSYISRAITLFFNQ